MEFLMIFISIMFVGQMMIFGFKLEKGASIGRTYVNSWKMVGRAMLWFFAPFFKSKK